MNDDLTRRSFLKHSSAAAAVVVGAAASRAQQAAKSLTTPQHRVIEIEWKSMVHYPDGYNDVDVDVTCTRPDGSSFSAPAFWDGGTTWRFRFAGDQPGEYHLESRSNRVDDAGLNAQRAVVRVTPAEGENPLYQHGRLRVADEKHHFEHADGTPFLWLGDTWWMGLCTRLDWPKGFH